MTRRDYIAIAEVLKRNRPDPFQDVAAQRIWRNVRDDMIGVLAADNSRFDPERFRRATEVTP